MADEIRTCADLEERLAAYVDGEDTPEERRLVETHLALCPACRLTAETEAVSRDLIRDHRPALCAGAPSGLKARCAAVARVEARHAAEASEAAASSSQLSASAKATADKPASSPELPASSLRARPSALRRWAPLSLAATLVLAVAGVFMFGLNDRVEALAASLAVDHIKCFKITGTLNETSPTAAEQAWHQDQGWSVTVPPTEAAHELKLVDVRRCFSTDGRAAHMMYTWRGAPLSVYVLQGDNGRDRVVRKMGTEAVIWCANNRTYAVVCNGHPGDLTQIVDYMKARVK